MILSIIILSYRNAPLLRLCLRSLARALHTTTLDYEVIVVDNATNPETANVVLHDCAKLFPSLRLIPLQHNTGYTYGVNTGLRAAQGEYLLSLNHDIIAQPGAIETLVAYAKAHPRVGLTGPQLLNLDGSHQDSCFKFYTPFAILARRFRLPFTKSYLYRFALRNRPHSRPTAVDWVSGAAFLVRRTVLEHIGYLDESFFHYFSDVDWSRRFWENEYAVMYVPLGTLYHGLGRASRGRLGLLDPLVNRATRWHIKDAIHYFRKHGISGHRPTATRPAQPTLIRV